jgi:transposase
VLLRGGMLPTAYVYPRKMRSTRDLLRRRMYLMYKRSELLAHIQNTNSQYNLPEFGKKIAYKANRAGVAESFKDKSARKNIEVDLQLLDYYDKVLQDVELFILKEAKHHDPTTLYLLQTIPGIGKILSLVILYEIHDISRFPRVQDFSSYSRLVKCSRESAGKKHGYTNSKVGNVHLKWAFSEAACLILRNNEPVQKYHNKLVNKYGKGKALSILANRIGRAVYFMLTRNKAFNMNMFLNQS